MSRQSREPQADPLYARPAAERPSYATGMLLDAQDFCDEQTYHRVQLARALAFLTGSGTMAGLGVTHRPAATGPEAHEEEIRVEPGIAIDRLGRLVEVPRPACVRLPPWFDAESARDGGDRLRLAAYSTFATFLSARALAEAGRDNRPAVPGRGVIADVFLRFVACPTGLTPSFGAGPFDQLNATTTARVRDAYELLLVTRPGLDAGWDGLPGTIPDLASIPDVTARRAQLQDDILAGYPIAGRSGAVDELEPLVEHAAGMDPTSIFLARVVIPVAAANPPSRSGSAVVVDSWRRRFVPSALHIARWIGAGR